jgi:hypothetical protein
MTPESKRFLRIILNGKAAGNPELRTAVGALRERGYRIDVGRVNNRLFVNIFTCSTEVSQTISVFRYAIASESLKFIRI